MDISLPPESPNDYVAVSTTIEFDSCEVVQCIDMNLHDDMMHEMVESFAVTLERTPDLDDRITLSPVDGEIEIVDNDSK